MSERPSIIGYLCGYGKGTPLRLGSAETGGEARNHAAKSWYSTSNELCDHALDLAKITVQQSESLPVLAKGWCVQQSRATTNFDVNIAMLTLLQASIARGHCLLSPSGSQGDGSQGDKRYLMC